MPALLLTHGYGATSAMFSQNLAALGAGNEVVTWDIRGHGGSESPADPGCYSAAAALSDMAALLDELGHEPGSAGRPLTRRVPVAGLRAHLSRPGGGLVLIDTGPGFRNDEAREDWNRRAEGTATRLAEQGLAALGGERRVARRRPPGRRRPDPGRSAAR